MSFTFLPTGDLMEAMAGGIQLNQLAAHPLDGSLSGLYLRVRSKDGWAVHPLLGARSGSLVCREDSRFTWRGEAQGVCYEVSFLLSSGYVWFWDIKLEANDPELEADLVYGQDIGLAVMGTVRSNEAYNSQYIDHSAYESEERGWAVCSRQNQPQDGRFPYLQLGSLTGAASYSTDGFSFFGLNFKDSHTPEALLADQLPAEIRQYEFAYTALQSQPLKPAATARVVFYGLFQEDHRDAVTEEAFKEDIRLAWQDVDQLPPAAGPWLPLPRRSDDIGEPIRSEALTSAELIERYPQRLEEERLNEGWLNSERRDDERREEGRLDDERLDDELLSFFTPEYAHVVTKAKELRMERPHGHILMSGAPDRAGAELLSSTAYMYGVFHSQLVVGNTSFNKLIGHTRNALNAQHASGLRLYAESEGVYRLLALPSLFEMGFNYARWVYRLKDDTIVVTSYTSADQPQAVLQVTSENGRPRRYLLTAQLVMGEREGERPYHMKRVGKDMLEVTPGEGSPIAEVYPRLAYRLQLDGTSALVLDERRLMPELQATDAPLLVLETEPSADWKLVIDGRLDGFGGQGELSKQDGLSEQGELSEQGGLSEQNGLLAQSASSTNSFPSLETAAREYRTGMEKLMNGFRLEHPEGNAAVSRLDILAWWYTHNMRVHFASPHGLEQYGGAAWGTRDVCQGPAEYFLAVRQDEAVRDIIRLVYSHQYKQSGGWPQWFMFDQYSRIQQEECHGDIIVWPLKLLGDYIAATGDLDILGLELPYTDSDSFELTELREPLILHVRRQMDYMTSRFLHGTLLSAYGDGDWDDTLQPASPELRANMSSSWTVALTYQTLEQLGNLLVKANESLVAASEMRLLGKELRELAAGIRVDFNRFMNPDDIIPGFLYLEDPSKPAKWLHPSDTRTGIKYRLLPMTRSMIAGLLTPDQAERHYELIKRELSFPDGVRLMNSPAPYEGGVSKRFKRAEQAANFGREIGLQYVHAHIRFIEAMAKLGKNDEAWHGLQVINPVGIKAAVPNAELRQSNAYFSSSDGNFATRYEAAERFDELRTGKASVKGGWRIYSSGPGIYMNQLISNVLGIRVRAETLELDPALPGELDGLSLRFRIANHLARITYLHSGGPIVRVKVNGREAPFTPLQGPYRSTGASLSLQDLDKLWLPGEQQNEIVLEG
ncbi:cellobiose phosphorylase [Paenibacillus herberti]|uniref:Cellobiose phosphorylase n=2 Tax=Paenibacillus herberti TaxID=1619309 RepID=A0A229NTT5_9BACL|nr:hypothetical protein [Paenibacillus herberti]OXM13242.1 cellobiose phosphorylase [Paenibacillus herberti]